MGGVAVRTNQPMYTKTYMYTHLRTYMSGKLYHRIKKNGKWTWIACQTPAPQEDGKCQICVKMGGGWCHLPEIKELLD